MIEIQQDEIEIIISNAQKPKSIANSGYPLNDLDDRIFEILTYSVFKKRLVVEKPLKKRFDDVILMQGVGEKGMDCVLFKKSKIASIIQCKKYKANLSEKLILSEIIKFSLHVLVNPTAFELGNNFTYFLATTTGYTGKSNLLPNSLNSGAFTKEYNLKLMTNEVVNKYKEFKNIDFEEIEKKLIHTIKSFKYVFIRPVDFDLWINDFPNLIETFFEVRKVTDNKLIEQKSNEIIHAVKEIFSVKETNEIKGFNENYRKVASEKLNVVNFIGFDIQKHRQRPDDITLTDLFVQPSFRQRINEKNEKVFSVVDRELKITNLLKSEKNIILLGDPGAGKSLLVKFLMVSIINNQTEKLGIKQLSNHLPLRIELRKYNEVRENKSIIEYLSDILTKEFQTKISRDQLEKIIEYQPTLIFFDGLDEIFNISHKSKIKEAIETFGTRFHKSKCIVTSRFIGYHDIKFNPKKFDEFAILQFNNNQISELVSKFYLTQQSSLEKKNNAIANCLEQLTADVDEELKSNPLILTLILILTSNNIIIPDSKLEIYESCTKTLVDSIDTTEKELKFEMPVKNKNLTFSHLAYWQYESTSKSTEISYPKAVKTIADFLQARKETKEYLDAEAKAERFLEYAERRSIYFENNFTHKTFLEYFTAEYLYSTCIAKASDEGRKKLITVVTKYLPSSFWYIVFELLFTRIDRIQPDNELLDEIFSKQLESHSLDVFYFLISNLSKFNNVSIDVKKEIIKRTIMLCIKGEKMKNAIRREFHFKENSILYKLNLLQSDKETQILLQDIFLNLENDGLNEKQEIELYNLFYEVISFDYRTSNTISLTIRNKKRVEELASKDILLYSNVYLSKNIKAGKIDISILINQIENFGHKSLFTYIPLRHSENRRRIDTFDLYLLSIIEDNNFDSFKSDIKNLMEHGLKFEYMLEHVKGTRLLYYSRSHGLEKILKLYIKSDDKNIDEILVHIIRRDQEMKVAYDKFRSENKHPKLKEIDKIFVSPNKKA